ncbi:MAG: hypothetical protein A2W25_11050 [candidate division Zixibacteria bacterium RBG_16_53_22]|nr:MAG: hypothetical protein A2W25_11050 [candidate division Zixibacteria bacterium RBG_16_53_22]
MKKVIVVLTGALSLIFLHSVIAMANPVAPEWGLIDTTAPPRFEHKCAYDLHREVIVLFGGQDYTDFLPNDTWEFSETWNMVSTSGPSGRTGHDMCYDTAAHVTILFGGRDIYGNYLNDTWTWNGANWTQLAVAGPSPRAFFVMAYDRCTRKAVLFGGANSDSLFGDTWEWDGSQWTLMAVTGPPARVYAAMAYKEWDVGKCFIFGGRAGFSGPSLNDTWYWDGGSWNQIPAGNINPSPRYGHSMAWDQMWEGFMILFGGQSGTNPDTIFGDTWLFWFDWVNGSYDVEPPARTMAAMVSCVNMGRSTLLIGGTDGTQIFNDMWAYPVFASNSYVPGDANGDGQFNGLDIVYLVGYFKGFGAPPPFVYHDCPTWGQQLYAAADLNGSCTVNGIDVTYGVAYLKGLQPSIRYCQYCPPTAAMDHSTFGKGDIDDE